MARFTDTRLR